MAPKSPEDKKKQFVLLVGNMELVGCDHCGSQIYVTIISVPLSQNKEGDNVLSRIFFFFVAPHNPWNLSSQTRG